MITFNSRTKFVNLKYKKTRNKSIFFILCLCLPAGRLERRSHIASLLRHLSVSKRSSLSLRTISSTGKLPFSLPDGRRAFSVRLLEYIKTKNKDVFLIFYFVPSRGVEPLLRDPQSRVLSTERRGRRTFLILFLIHSDTQRSESRPVASTLSASGRSPEGRNDEGIVLFGIKGDNTTLLDTYKKY